MNQIEKSKGVIFCLFALLPTDISVIYVRVSPRKMTVVRKLFRTLWRRSFCEFRLPGKNARVVLTQSPSRDIAQTELGRIHRGCKKWNDAEFFRWRPCVCYRQRKTRAHNKIHGGRRTQRGEERTEWLRSTYRKRGMCLLCARAYGSPDTIF